MSDAAAYLHHEGKRWPIIDGIAFMRTDRRELAEEALAALDEGDAETACVILLADQDGWASTPPPSEANRRRLVRERGTLNFRDAMDLLEFGPVGTYFAHRWSDPTFLSGLALAEAHWHSPTRIVELACGAGHYLREFKRVQPDAEITGIDLVFAKLWLARHFIAPTARLMCFDAAQDWPLPDASADMLFCHDAFYFLPDKQRVATEMLRVGGTGRILIGHAHNAAVENLSHGAPLVPADYAALFGTALLYDDAELTAALVDGRAPRPAEARDLLRSPAVGLATGVAATDTPRIVAGGLAMPQPGSELRRNPLYAGNAQRAERRFPSPRYEAEYASLATYRQTTNAPATVLAGDPAYEDAIRRRELLDLPASW